MDMWNFLWDYIKLIFGFLAFFDNVCKEGFVGDRCETECGLTFYEPNERIVGGVEANPRSWPSTVYITAEVTGNVYIKEINRYVFVEEEVDFVCAGTLISTSSVLTAASCIIDILSVQVNSSKYTILLKPNDQLIKYYVYLGVHDRSTVDDDYENIIQVDKVIMHPKYNGQFYLNDVAILKLSKSATLSKTIQIACLPGIKGESYPATNQPAWAVGWGITDESSEDLSDVLRNVKLNIYDINTCSEMASDYPNDWKNQICAGYMEGGRNPCIGDGGGGLFVSDKVGGHFKFVLAGIISYGDDCDDSDSPGVYTRVSGYLDWINKHL